MELPTKELYEVIIAVEKCGKDEGTCKGCPYFSKDGKHKCFSNYGNQMLKDTLYYLKIIQRRN